MRGLNDFRNLASNLSVALPVMLGLCLTLKLLYPSKPCLVSPRVSCYFLGLFLIGPGLLVNGLLKSFWGRPRPVSTQDFGGPWPFHEAWVMADHGLFNRSFTSGEAATVACLLPLALFVPREWRWQVTALVAIFVAATSLNRIAFGAHFLSDVTISIALMLLIAAVLRYLMFVRHAAHWNDEVLEARLTRLGEDGARSRAALALRLRGASVAAWQKAGALAAVSRANTNGLLTHVSTLMARAGASRLPGRQSSAVS
ncbi:phosphatase PAP2 family protein [Ancylobacter radicis]|nr:phosphatase PAP2 family protein [Ancylobacter radicis]